MRNKVIVFENQKEKLEKLEKTIGDGGFKTLMDFQKIYYKIKKEKENEK